MTRNELIANILRKRSFLCVGLDTDMDKIPPHLLEQEDPIFAFNKAIIDATKDLAVAYKPNLAFYERQGVEGWKSLKRTIDYIPKDLFIIADAKRGDIGNTSRYYAQTFFESMNCDAVTVAPYMGSDSVTPFLEFEGKWVILLALTSNEGALDLQFSPVGNKMLFERVIERSREWATDSNLMYVVGATRGEMLSKARSAAGNHFFLIPGVGAQGGSMEDVVEYAMTDEVGVLVNASRSVIYASNGPDFATAARKEAMALRDEMEQALIFKGLV